MMADPGGRRTLTVLVLAAVCAIAPRLAQASSQDLFGMGARGIAMGGAVVSNTSGFAAVYYNPAGLMLVDEKSFTVGYQRADFNLSLNDDDYDVTPASNLLIGLNIPLPFGGVLENRLAIGFGFILPTASVLRAEVPAPEDPFFVLVEHRSQVVGVHAGLAARVTDWLYLGVSVVALAELLGSLDVAPNETGSLGTVVRDELVADYAPIGGILLTPAAWMSIGVTIHGPSEARFTFPITADLGEQFPIEVPLLNVSGVAQYDPMVLSADITFRPTERIQIAIGMSFKKWSDFINPIENTTAPVPEQDAPNFSNVVVPRFGFEYMIPAGEHVVDLRLGTFLEQSPVPNQEGNSNFLDSDRFGVGFGVGWAWRGLRADLAVQGQLMRSRTHNKIPDQVRDPENPGLPEISQDGSIIVSVFEVGVAF